MCYLLVTISACGRWYEYDPGKIRVRVTMYRDILSVLRSRYMDIVFRVASLIFVSYVALSVQRTASTQGGVGTRTVEVLEMRMMDFCSLAAGELGWLFPLLAVVFLSFVLRRKKTVYLLDFALFDPPPAWKKSKQDLTDLMAKHAEHEPNSHLADPEKQEFLSKVLANSGTGDATAWPPGILTMPPNTSMEATRGEASTIVCDVRQRPLFVSAARRGGRRPAGPPLAASRRLGEVVIGSHQLGEVRRRKRAGPPLAGAREAVRDDWGQAEGDRLPGHQLLALLADALPLRHGVQPLRHALLVPHVRPRLNDIQGATSENAPPPPPDVLCRPPLPQVQPLGAGLLRLAALGRPGLGAAAEQPQLHRRRRLHRDHHPVSVRRRPPS